MADSLTPPKDCPLCQSPFANMSTLAVVCTGCGLEVTYPMLKRARYVLAERKEHAERQPPVPET